MPITTVHLRCLWTVFFCSLQQLLREWLPWTPPKACLKTLISQVSLLFPIVYGRVSDPAFGQKNQIRISVTRTNDLDQENQPGSEFGTLGLGTWSWIRNWPKPRSETLDSNLEKKFESESDLIKFIFNFFLSIRSQYESQCNCEIGTLS